MFALDYYRILGISPNATWVEVRRRYRVLARQYHPDRNPDNPEAAAHFLRVQEAYEAIQELKSKAKPRPRPAAQKYRSPRFSHQEDVFADLFGIPRSGAILRQSCGADFRYDLQIPFAAAVLGTKTVIQVPRNSNCHHCGGTGLTPGSAYQDCADCQGRGRRFGGPGLLRFGPHCESCRGRGKVAAQPCRHCRGQGYSHGLREYRLSIAPGTLGGTRLRLAGEGGDGFHHGPPGNLEVVIHVEPHEFFTRLGNDLHCLVKVTFAQAALGGTLRIPTLRGHRTLTLPRGTRPGQVFRFAGLGAPGGPHEPPGDQVMEVVLTSPERLIPRPRAPIWEGLTRPWAQAAASRL
jgi:molecular chaperone DnaJ